MRSLHPEQALSGMLVACLCFLTAAMLMPRTGNAQDAELTKSMAALKDRTAKLGDPKDSRQGSSRRQGRSCLVFRLYENEQQCCRGR